MALYNPEKPRLLVALGGRSSEREVSIDSGKNVASALERKGYPTSAFDFGTGRFLQIPELEGIEKDPHKLPKVVDYPLTDMARHFQLVFIAMHGRFGEDGGLQSLLEEIGMKYTGSGPLSSALAMDKKFTKFILEAHRIATAKYQIVKSASQKPDFPFPVVVKPKSEGSSVGVSICENKAEYEMGVKGALKYSDEVMIEPYLNGKEITVPILEKTTDAPEALPVIEIVPQTKFFDYKAKYNGTTREIVPARIPPQIAKEAQRLALETYKALGCRHFARVDMVMDKANKIFVLELNTIPGLTAESLFPKAAKAAGYDFAGLIEHIITIAQK